MSLDILICAKINVNLCLTDNAKFIHNTLISSMFVLICEERERQHSLNREISHKKHKILYHDKPKKVMTGTLYIKPLT